MRTIELTTGNILSFEHLFTSHSAELIKKESCFGYGVADDDVVVGVIMCETVEEERGACIIELYVEEPVRRQGIGSMLLNAAADEAKRRELIWITFPFHSDQVGVPEFIESDDRAQIMITHDRLVGVYSLTDESDEILSSFDSKYENAVSNDPDVMMKLNGYNASMLLYGIDCYVGTDRDNTPCVVINNEYGHRMMLYVLRGEEDEEGSEDYVLMMYCSMAIDEVYLDEVKADMDAAIAQSDLVMFRLDEEDRELSLFCNLAEENGTLEDELLFNAYESFMSAVGYITPEIG